MFLESIHIERTSAIALVYNFVDQAPGTSYSLFSFGAVLPKLAAWGHLDFWVHGMWCWILAVIAVFLMVALPLMALAGLLALWLVPLGAHGRFCAYTAVRFVAVIQTLDIGVVCLWLSTFIVKPFMQRLLDNIDQGAYNVNQLAHELMPGVPLLDLDITLLPGVVWAAAGAVLLLALSAAVLPHAAKAVRDDAREADPLLGSEVTTAETARSEVFHSTGALPTPSTDALTQSSGAPPVSGP